MRRVLATIAAFTLALILSGFPMAALATEATLHEDGETGIGLTTQVPERGDDPDDGGDAREGTRPMPQTGDPYAGATAAMLALLAGSGALCVLAGHSMRTHDGEAERR